jgi:hypothetical protein
MNLVMAPDDGHRAERLAVQIVDHALEILPHAAVQRGVDIGRGMAEALK